MRIKKKRIRSINNNFPRGLFGKKIIPGIVLDIEKDKNCLEELGFSNRLEIGETILPSINYGSVCRFNAEGKETINKQKPKETRYREFEWTRQQWAGRGKTEEVSDFRTRAYERYHRDFINPPSIEISISKKEGKNVFVTSKRYILDDKEEKNISHATNLFLEIFGQCDVLDENEVPIIPELRKLNWTILPPGEKPWVELKKLLDPVIKANKNTSERPVIEARFEDMASLKPDFTAIGQQGFSGYVAFGFKKKGIYAMESVFYGNAIYVFDEDWKNLSKMTKAEILKNNLQIERITHRGEKNDWLGKLQKYLEQR